jgi:poly-D-alanine transfer protein DltD
LLVAAYFAGWATAKYSTQRSEAEAKAQLRRALRAEQQARDQAFRQAVTLTDLVAQNPTIAKPQIQLSEREAIHADAMSKTTTERIEEVVRKLPPEPSDRQASRNLVDSED